MLPPRTSPHKLPRPPGETAYPSVDDEDQQTDQRGDLDQDALQVEPLLGCDDVDVADPPFGDLVELLEPGLQCFVHLGDRLLGYAIDLWPA